MVTSIAGPHYTLEGPDSFNLLPYPFVFWYSGILIKRFLGGLLSLPQVLKCKDVLCICLAIRYFL